MGLMESWQLFVTSLGENISGWIPKAELKVLVFFFFFSYRYTGVSILE